MKDQTHIQFKKGQLINIRSKEIPWGFVEKDLGDTVEYVYGCFRDYDVVHKNKIILAKKEKKKNQQKIKSTPSFRTDYYDTPQHGGPSGLS